MKATINENGVLTVEAETPVERYALMQWWRCFPGNSPSEEQVEAAPRPRSSLRVIYEEEDTQP